MILKVVLKTFDFQCDFDFKSSLFRWFDFDLKLSTYDDFAHLCVQLRETYKVSNLKLHTSNTITQTK